MASNSAISTTSPRLRGIDSPDDDLNQGIIKLLQEDGRLPYKEVASSLGVSEGTIRNRVQSMKRSGLLKIVALSDPMALRYKADAMIGIKVASPASPRIVAERLAQFSEVVYVLWVSGRYDLLIEVVCETSEAFQSFLEIHCFGSDDIDQFILILGSFLGRFAQAGIVNRQHEGPPALA